MPLLVILLSVLGLVPFVACGLAALGPDAAASARMLGALIGYAAVVLAFAGGVHWGLQLSPQQSSAGQTGSVERARIVLAVVPMLVGWIALVLPLVVAPWVSLLVLVAGYIALVVVEHQASRRGLLPPRYLWLRWGFTVIAVAMLVTVLVLRLLGLSTQN